MPTNVVLFTYYTLEEVDLTYAAVTFLIPLKFYPFSPWFLWGMVRGRLSVSHSLWPGFPHITCHLCLFCYVLVYIGYLYSLNFRIHVLIHLPLQLGEAGHCRQCTH